MKVLPAQPYDPNETGSLGHASCMLLRQFQFPDEFFAPDKHTQADHDRLLMWDHGHTSNCFKKHMDTGDMGLGDWVRHASDENILNFLKDVLKTDSSIKWTGYRVTVTVHRGTGYPVWGLELFAKHPSTDTVVYTGQNAPNVLGSSRAKIAAYG